MIDRDLIDRIRDETSIIAVIGEVVKLKRRGRSHVGLCPFHPEKTPSFHVDDERAKYHCFGCGASGDVFTFVEQHEGLPFGEAVRRLAERAGVEVRESTSAVQRQQEDEARQIRQSLHDVGAAAAGFFERMLVEHPFGRLAAAELERFGLTVSVPPDPVRLALSGFRVGYAPYGWDLLVQYLRQSGLRLDAAERLGLVGSGRGGREVFDRFRHRLVTAVLDLHGRVVAFVGYPLPEPSEAEIGQAGAEPMRLMDRGEADREMRCPDSIVYQPASLVFGLHQARQAIRSSDQCVLVRGPLDVVVLHAHGVVNAVASLGETLTSTQAQLLRRFCAQVVFLRSGDASGRRAVAVSRDTCRQAGLLVKVAMLPEGVDAGQQVRSGGAESVRRVMASARGLVEFLVDSTLGSDLLSDPPTRRAARVRYVAAILERETDPLLRALTEQYADSVVTRLGYGGTRSFRELSALVRAELSRRTAGPARSAPDLAAAEAIEASPSHAVLGVLIDFPTLLRDAEVVPMLAQVSGDAAAVVAAVRRATDPLGRIDRDALLSRLAPELVRLATTRLAAPEIGSIEAAREALVGLLRSLRISS